MEFATEQQLKDINKSLDRKENFALPCMFLPYHSPYPVIYNRPLQTDPFFGMQLPPYNADSFFVVWRYGAEINQGVAACIWHMRSHMHADIKGMDSLIMLVM